MEYYVAICQLFQPLLNFSGFTVSARDYLASVASQCAGDGIQLLQQYQATFGNLYQTPLQPFCLVHLCDSLIRNGSLESAATIEFCLKSLHEALPRFPYIGPIQAMFCQSVQSLGHSLPDNLVDLMGGRTQYDPEELLDACGRLTYAQPTDLLLDRLDHSIAEDFEAEWRRYIEERGGSEGSKSPASSKGSDTDAGSRRLSINSFINRFEESRAN